MVCDGALDRFNELAPVMMGPGQAHLLSCLGEVSIDLVVRDDRVRGSDDTDKQRVMEKSNSLLHWVAAGLEGNRTQLAELTKNVRAELSEARTPDQDLSIRGAILCPRDALAVNAKAVTRVRVRDAKLLELLPDISQFRGDSCDRSESIKRVGFEIE